MNFKKGDKVKLSEKHIHTCGTFMTNGILDNGIDYFIIDEVNNSHYVYTGYNVNGQRINYCSHCFTDDDFIAYSNKKNKTKKVLPPKFILQYEINGDPIEEFATLNEVKTRIKELVAKGGHSYKVYEIKKMWKPIVEKKEVITIKGL